MPMEVATRLLAAFAAGDVDGMRRLLAEDLVAHIITADGDSLRVEGRDAYLSRIEAMDLGSASFSVEPTQPPVEVDAGRILLMVEIRAERGGRELHNFAAHLLGFAGEQVSEWWMVDAKPAESDAFWAS